MTAPAPVPGLADPSRAMPATAPQRRAAADAAVASLKSEQHRLERLGLEWPLARTQRQLRYWQFVRALCVIAAEAS